MYVDMYQTVAENMMTPNDMSMTGMMNAFLKWNMGVRRVRHFKRRVWQAQGWGLGLLYHSLRGRRHLGMLAIFEGWLWWTDVCFTL
jgi:hypothetical protein